MRRAVIDVGSNSVLLTVAEEREGVWVPILETTDVTALGEGVKLTGKLGEAGMASTLQAVKEAFDHARGLKCETVVACVTMAARIAKNADDFLERAKEQGTPITILSGDDEAELGFLAVANDPTFSRFSNFSIVDVGGHSTEISSRDNRRSYPIGTLGLLSGTLSAEMPDSMARFRAAAEIDEVLDLKRGSLTHVDQSLTHPHESLIHVDESLIHVDESLIHVDESLIHVDESLIHPHESLIHVDESLIHVGESLILPHESFIQPLQSVAHGVVIALGATGTNLVSIRDKMATWHPEKVHGAYLDYEEVGRAVAWLSSMSLDERSKIVGMEKGREKTLPGGALILERALYALKAEGCYVSVRGWRHALLERLEPAKL